MNRKEFFQKNKNKIIKNPGFLRFSIADSREI